MNQRNLNKLKRSFESRYFDLRDQLFSQLKTSHFTKLRDCVLIKNETFEELSNLNWFFLKQIERLLKIESLVPNLSDDSKFNRVENDVFDLLIKTEFAMIFLGFTNQGNSIKSATVKTLEKIENHLICLGERHLFSNSLYVNNDYVYQSSFGENSKRGAIKSLPFKDLKLGDKSLTIFHHNNKEFLNFSQRIESALSIIALYSPSSWERFEAFTDVIIPVKNEELVSYSHQELPGYSMINLYHRDFVDLLDDLLHENGHHHLNHYLNISTLIEEPEDNNYYSPWRQTLRPLRGIYHGFFTFFWAFKLFTDLSKNGDLYQPFYSFSEIELEKMKWRAIEEFHMLKFTYTDLQMAFKEGLIYSRGFKLIEELWVELNQEKFFIENLETKLKHFKFPLQNLKNTLRDAHQNYR
jgi:hypothetical protein